MNITLESQPCPKCRTENSVHIDDCRFCGHRLPWSGTELTRAGREHEQRATSSVERQKAIWYFGFAGLSFLVGVLFSTAYFSGYHAAGVNNILILFIASAGFLKHGENMLLDVEDVI